jgi:hypothetical protein
MQAEHEVEGRPRRQDSLPRQPSWRAQPVDRVLRTGKLQGTPGLSRYLACHGRLKVSRLNGF